MIPAKPSAEVPTFRVFIVANDIFVSAADALVAAGLSRTKATKLVRAAKVQSPPRIIVATVDGLMWGAIPYDGQYRVGRCSFGHMTITEVMEFFAKFEDECEVSGVYPIIVVLHAGMLQ